MKVILLAAMANAVRLQQDYSGSSVFDLGGNLNALKSFIMNGEVPEGTTALNGDEPRLVEFYAAQCPSCA